MSYLQCPDCLLRVSAGAYFLRAHCPRCRSLLEPQAERRPAPAATAVLRPAGARPTGS